MLQKQPIIDLSSDVIMLKDVVVYEGRLVDPMHSEIQASTPIAPTEKLAPQIPESCQDPDSMPHRSSM